MEYLDLPRDIFSPINRQELRIIIGTMFQTGKFVNGTPITREHPKSVEGTGRDEGRTYSGVTIPLDYWRKMLRMVEFNQGSSSSANWEEYSMGGLKDESRSEGTWIMASFIYDSDWHGSKVSHQLVINYRGPKGEFTSYVGNVEDFFNQVHEFVKSIGKRKQVITASNKFGLGDGDTTMSNLLKNVEIHDKMEDAYVN